MRKWKSVILSLFCFVKFLLSQKWSCYAVKFMPCTSEVKFAHHFAVRRNFTHKVNFTIEDNFTCPKGKLSFSVFSVKDNTLMLLPFFYWLCLNATAPFTESGRLIFIVLNIPRLFGIRRSDSLCLAIDCLDVNERTGCYKGYSRSPFSREARRVCPAQRYFRPA